MWREISENCYYRCRSGRIVFGGILPKAGQSVTVFTRTEASASVINQEGITLTGRMSSITPVEAKHELNENETFDLVIVAVKSYHVSNVLKQFKPLWQKGCSWLFVQNGMDHLEELTSIPSSVYLGVMEYGLYKHDHRAVVDVRGIGQLKMAVYRNKQVSSSNKEVETLFPFSNLNVVWMDGYQKMLEDKLVVNVCINPLTAILQVKNGELRTNPIYQKEMHAYFIEVMNVLERGDMEQMWEYVLSVCLKTAANESSMLVDLKRGRKLEL
ncbi:2-dehydropantoate 2-reductase [Bacillus sp. JCM 19045]|nr:2-dehydropantoate 2-reductase [Bacillus sp. JCM 19045]